MFVRLTPVQLIRGAALALCLLIPSLVLAETKLVTPTGEYAQIDTRLVIETMRVLSTGSENEKKAVIAAIRAAPENYAPPVFYQLSNVLFEKGEQDDAAFWFYAGQLRARFDANRCADTSARDAVSVLNMQFGSPINEYMFKDIPKLKLLIPRVVEWDRKTPHNYDHRWINLHGMSAMMSGLGGSGSVKPVLSLPEDQWNDIAEKTRKDYLEGFQQAMTDKHQPFDTQDGQVRFTDQAGRHYVVTGADDATIKFVGGRYGKDKLHVFYADKLVEGADPTTFVAIGEEAGHDAKSVYFDDKVCATCDPASFRSLAKDWYADKSTAYLHSEPEPDVDASTFKLLNTWFAKDSRNVYLVDRKIPGADAASFKLESCGLSEVTGEDKNRCYWFDHATPCDCGLHTGLDFAYSVVQIPPREALLADSGGVAVDVNELAKHPDLGAAFHPNPSGYWTMSAGYLRVYPGRHEVPLDCWDRDHVRVRVAIDFEAGGLYRVRRRKGTACDIDVERPSLVVGRIDAPEVQIRIPGDAKKDSQIELPAGPHDLNVVCRYITRTEAVESEVTIPHLEIEAGRIYMLDASFKPGDKKCDVRAVKLPNSK